MQILSYIYYISAYQENCVFFKFQVGWVVENFYKFRERYSFYYKYHIFMYITCHIHDHNSHYLNQVIHIGIGNYLYKIMYIIIYFDQIAFFILNIIHTYTLYTFIYLQTNQPFRRTKNKTLHNLLQFLETQLEWNGINFT